MLQAFPSTSAPKMVCSQGPLGCAGEAWPPAPAARGGGHALISRGFRKSGVSWCMPGFEGFGFSLGGFGDVQGFWSIRVAAAFIVPVVFLKPSG